MVSVGIEDAAAQARYVAAESAIGNGHRRRTLIVDPATGRAGMAIPDRKAGNRDGLI